MQMLDVQLKDACRRPKLGRMQKKIGERDNNNEKRHEEGQDTLQALQLSFFQIPSEAKAPRSATARSSACLSLQK